jgi:hypothetical protein
MQDYEVGLVGLGDGEKSYGNRDTCILIHLYSSRSSLFGVG